MSDKPTVENIAQHLLSTYPELFDEHSALVGFNTIRDMYNRAYKILLETTYANFILPEYYQFNNIRLTLNHDMIGLIAYYHLKTEKP